MPAIHQRAIDLAEVFEDLRCRLQVRKPHEPMVHYDRNHSPWKDSAGIAPGKDVRPYPRRPEASSPVPIQLHRMSDSGLARL